jgi:Fe-S-cluster containining protein
VSRQERRRRLSRLGAVIEEIERRGLSPAPDLIELAAVVAMIDGTMDRAPPTGRSGRVLKRLAELQDRSNANASFQKEVACRKGCAFCCSLYVSALPPEIFAIADFIRGGAADLAAEIARIEAADANTRGLDPSCRFLAKSPCALLTDGACSVYTVRPMVCRGVLSRSREACESAYRGHAFDNRAEIEPAVAIRSAYGEAILVTLHRKGLDLRAYELAHAVLVALKDASAEGRWYAGADVFAGVAADAPAIRAGDELFWDSLWNAAHGEPVPPGPYAGRFPDWCR